MPQEMQDCFGQFHLSDGHKNIVIQMAKKFPLKEIDMSKKNSNAETIATNICKAIDERNADVDPALKTATALSDYEALLTATLTPSLEPVDQASADVHVVLEHTSVMDQKLYTLMTQTEATGEQKRLHDFGDTENALIKLARRMAWDTQELEAAWAKLQNAMEIAMKVQADGHNTSKHGGFVDEVMRRVAKLAPLGEYASTSAQIVEALDEGEAAYKVKQTRLMDRGGSISRCWMVTAKGLHNCWCARRIWRLADRSHLMIGGCFNAPTMKRGATKALY